MDEETRRSNFVRIAERRANAIIAAIRSLRRLKNKSYYKYDSTDLDAMFKAIDSELKETRRYFTKEREFKL